MPRNIFGEEEPEVIIDFLHCPNGCDYVRVGNRAVEVFKCYYCKALLITEEEEAARSKREDVQALQSLTNHIVRGNG